MLFLLDPVGDNRRNAAVDRRHTCCAVAADDVGEVNSNLPGR
jgi:hypothetical protein